MEEAVEKVNYSEKLKGLLHEMLIVDEGARKDFIQL